MMVLQVGDTIRTVTPAPIGTPWAGEFIRTTIVCDAQLDFAQRLIDSGRWMVEERAAQETTRIPGDSGASVSPPSTSSDP